MAKATFRQSDLQRAIKPALELGLKVTGYEIGADGRIIVRTADAEGSTADAALDAWARKRDAARSA